jgi:hypothetical protein
MQRNTIVPGCSRVHLRPASHTPAILSRKGRKLWAGVQTPADEGMRMRNESMSNPYGTSCVESASTDSWETTDATSDCFRVKPQPETVE